MSDIQLKILNLTFDKWFDMYKSVSPIQSGTTVFTFMEPLQQKKYKRLYNERTYPKWTMIWTLYFKAYPDVPVIETISNEALLAELTRRTTTKWKGKPVKYKSGLPDKLLNTLYPEMYK